jgi:hypothetical protein
MFCPSHAYSTQPTRVDRAVLEALIGQETAGAWVRHVLDRLITATHQTLGPLGGVVVDHSPGLAALQSAVLGDIAQHPAGRMVAMITTCDRVDLAMCKAASTTHHDELKNAAWIVNRAPADLGSDAAIARDDPSIAADWHTRAHRVRIDHRRRDADRLSELGAHRGAPRPRAPVPAAVRSVTHGHAHPRRPLVQRPARSAPHRLRDGAGHGAPPPRRPGARGWRRRRSPPRRPLAVHRGHVGPPAAATGDLRARPHAVLPRVPRPHRCSCPPTPWSPPRSRSSGSGTRRRSRSSIAITSPTS